MAWNRAAMVMVSLMVMGTSQIRNSTVLKKGCTRISHQIFCIINAIGFDEQVHIAFVGFNAFKKSGIPVLGNLSNTLVRNDL